MPHGAPYRFFKTKTGRRTEVDLGVWRWELRGRFQTWRTLKCWRSHFWGGKTQNP